MGDLKSSIKQCKQLLADEKYEEAVEFIDKLVDDGASDYMIFCFGGLANAKMNYPVDSSDMYKKAIALDSSMPVAWQGLFKLYENGKVNPDERGIECCDKMISTSDSAEKRNAAVSVRRRLLLALSKFDLLKADLGTDEDLLTKVIERLSTKVVLSTTERELMSASFSQLECSFVNLPDVHRKYCLFVHSQMNGDWRSVVKNYCSVHSKSDDWVRSRLVEMFCEDYFISAEVNKELFGYLQFGSDDAPLTKIVNSIQAGDLSSCLEVVDFLSPADLTKYPTNLMVARLLAESENWELSVKVLDSIVEGKIEGTKDTATWLAIRSLFEMENSAAALKRFLDVSPSVTSEFAVECALLNSLQVDVCPFEGDGVPRERYDLAAAHAKSDFDSAVAIGDRLSSSADAQWNDLLAASEARLAKGMDCTTLLVKAARLNPRSSRAFFLLGKALLVKNPAKAKSCLERAVKIRPTNEQYVMLMDKCLSNANATSDLRLPILKKLAERTKPLWLRKSLISLFLISGDLDGAIGELQYLLKVDPDDVTNWTKLADAYASRGQLQSAVNAYDHVMELNPKSEYIISLLQVMMRLGRDELALERCQDWRAVAENPKALESMNILEAQLHLRLCSSTVGVVRRDHLRCVARLLDDVITKRTRMAIVYKLAGDTLLHIVNYKEKQIGDFELPSSWNVSSHSDALRQAVLYYATALDLNRANSLAWTDLAVAIMVRCRLEKDGCQLYAKKAVDSLKKAISLCRDPSSRSLMWTRLSEAKRLVGAGPSQQQHCLVRALQLNKANDEAWLRLAVLYSSVGELALAHQAFETALKHNPLSAESWSGLAAKADIEGHTGEAMDMFRHSLSIKPTAMAVSKYSAYLCVSQKDRRVPFDPSTVMVQFDMVLDMHDRREADSDELLHMAVLADQFGHYQEAADCLQTMEQVPAAKVHWQRAKIRSGSFDESANIDSRLHGLRSLASSSSESLLRLLKQHIPSYSKLFGCLEQENAVGLQSLLKESAKSISIPLVVAAIIQFNIPLCDEAVSYLHEVLPRHELIDVFPTRMPEGMDAELQFLEQDGEEPFRYRHHVARALFEELKLRRDALTPEVPVPGMATETAA